MSETHWGFIVHPAEERFDRAAVIEAVLRFLGLILVISAYAQWLLPGALFSGDVIVMKIAISLLFVTFGVALYWFANQGFRTEWQIDTARRELRMAHRNGRGISSVRARFDMDAVESAFVKRGAKAHHLFVRLAGHPDPMYMISGSEADLRTLNDRMRHDMRPPRQRVEARLAASERAQPRMSPRRVTA